MAKRNYEFQPDKPHSGVLSKLYLTRQQQKTVLRWLLLTAVVVAASVIQDVVLCKAELYGATTDLVPYAIILICVQLGADRSAIFALIAAALYKFSGTSPGYHVMALIPVLGLSAALLRQSYFRKSFSSVMLCTCSSVIVYEMLVFLVALIFSNTVPGRGIRFLITGLLSLVVCPIIYVLTHAIEKIGEKSWIE